MFKNKLFNIMLVILSTLTLMGVLTIVLYTQFFQETKAESELTIDEILRVSVETDEITTNLLSNHVIRSKFVFQLDNTRATTEFEKRDFQIENIIIQELADMKESDFRGSKGILELEKIIRDRVNEIMDDGYVVQVYMNARVIQ
ncbi:flagellar basal body-associated protein FliL [Evansella sp. AB-P1]|uniref:flagellar basal body-associated protein FliL n=1 Tax=Evansella sp. AB-P1 TaxID=3037653 RepID=UPI00241E10FC|nr:flagellar basal body-associated protein FliL [Evansella sp. AB-P1]MDG5788182.1 flagellar basal body-associated protein FliL [Evansella sp. AB-P1]